MSTRTTTPWWGRISVYAFVASVALVSGGAGCPGYSPPQTMKIAFKSDRSGNSEIFVMNVDGTNPTKLTNNPARR